MTDSWENFMEANPDWFDYTEEQVKEEWNYIAYCKAQAKQMNQRHEKGELTNAQFDSIKKFWSKFTLDVEMDF